MAGNFKQCFKKNWFQVNFTGINSCQVPIASCSGTMATFGQTVSKYETVSGTQVTISQSCRATFSGTLITISQMII